MNFLTKRRGYSVAFLVMTLSTNVWHISGYAVADMDRGGSGNVSDTAQKRSSRLGDLRRPDRDNRAQRDLSESQIEPLINKCFANLFSLSSHGLSPPFVVGDFNGDGMQDLFVPVRFVGSIKPSNSAKPNFNLEMVLGTGGLPKDKAFYDLRLGDLSVDNGQYFVVIHGAAGIPLSICPSVRNRFVLIYAMDKGSIGIRLYGGKRLPPGTIGDPKEDQPPPMLKGKAIVLLDSHKIGTALYWDGSRYRWYPFNYPASK
jgi:hypothetical protein